MKPGLRAAAAAAALPLAWLAAHDTWAATAGLAPCRLPGVEHQALCGKIERPLDPAQPAGRRIELHYAVIPALARNKRPDPVLFFAGGPGQSAIELAGSMGAVLARLANRRDLVFIDQRGTGRSAPLACAPPAPTAPLAEAADPERQFARLAECRAALEKLPHGDLRHYTTWIAAQDADAVRRALGAEQVNLVGASYGTRVALEVQRQFPQAVRRAVLDGVAPPDMVLPVSFSADNQAALDAVLAACAAEARCAARHPTLRADWARLLASLPRQAPVRHPVTGATETISVTRDLVLGLVRAPLYVPALASALPQALAEAAREGRFEGLFGLAAALGGGARGRLAEGMHMAVVCSEDQRRAAGAGDAPGRDFGASFAELYRRACADWPRGSVPEAFYTLAPAPAPTLLLSGGADPATPPRHGERVARALGPLARHVVVPQAGHGVLALPCVRDLVYRFIDASDAGAAAALDAGCAVALPRPGIFVPVEAPR